jgi:two-component system sensor histidine kinase KdpD
MSAELISKELSDSGYAVATWAFKNNQKAGWTTDTLSSSKVLAIPLATNFKTYGVLLIQAKDKTTMNILKENILETIVKLISESIEKYFFLKEAEETNVLKESEKLHQALFNSVSHEMKTPLTALIGASTTLIDENKNANTDTMNLLENIRSSSYRLNRVVVNLLDMSRLAGGVHGLQKEYFEANDFLENIINFYFSDKKIVLTKEQGEELFLFGDSKLMEHAFVNLIQNAIQYSPESTTVRIEISKIGSSVNFKIIDQGIGIVAGDEDKIFERFYRSNNAKAGGTGLGLSIVKEVVSLHSGKVWAKKNIAQSGSCFTVELPIATKVI